MFLIWIYYGLGHHHTESNKKTAHIRERQIEMSKYVSYAMRALEYSKPCTEKQTRVKEMSATPSLSHSK